MKLKKKKGKQVILINYKYKYIKHFISTVYQNYFIRDIFK